MTTCDHKGVEYRSRAEMARKYGISPVVLALRLRRKWTLELALTTPVRPRAVTAVLRTDHNGTVYKTQCAMAKAYGIDRAALLARLRRNWSIQEALTTPQRRTVQNRRHACVDHKGNKFSSQSARAKAYGLYPAVVANRLRYGWSLEDALTVSCPCKRQKPRE